MSSEKGKHNPFAAFLRPSETLLWQSSEQNLSLGSVIPKINLYTVTTIGLLIVVVAIIVSVAQASDESPMGLVGFIGLVASLAGFWIRVTMNGAKRGGTIGTTLPDHATYAVTSERLFYQRGEDLQAVSLEQLSQVHTMPDSSTLSFGPVFPMWTGLDNAEQVKIVIKQAQKERFKEIHT